MEPTPPAYTLQPTLWTTTTRAEKVDKSTENIAKQAALPSSTCSLSQTPASGPGDDEREETESAASSSAAEMAQGLKSEDAGYGKEETDSGPVKDKSVRRRFLGWVNKKTKDYYANKIEKTIKREQEEGDDVYQSCKRIVIL